MGFSTSQNCSALTHHRFQSHKRHLLSQKNANVTFKDRMDLRNKVFFVEKNIFSPVIMLKHLLQENKVGVWYW